MIRANACSNNPDDGHPPLPQDLRFSRPEVLSGFNVLNCALGPNGFSKLIIAPILIIIAPAIASLFTALLRFSVSPSDWQIAVLCLIKKKSSDRSNLNNFRAVHLVCFFYSINGILLASVREFCLLFLQVSLNNSEALSPKAAVRRLS